MDSDFARQEIEAFQEDGDVKHLHYAQVRLWEAVQSQERHIADPAKTDEE